MIHFFFYLLEASLGLAFAHFIYRIFLRKHTKFQLNRFFLLLFIGLSLSIPLVEFSIDISPDTALANGLTYVESLDMALEEFTGTEIILENYEEASYPIWFSSIVLVYLLGCVFGAIPILKSWQDLLVLIFTSDKYKESGFTWLDSPNSHSFSAFHYIFLSKELNHLPKENQTQIIQHEKVHAAEWHSLDLIFLDLIRILFWFHPLKNTLKKDLQELHECLADAQVTQHENKYQYSRLIVQLAHEVEYVRDRGLPVHAFAYSPIKHRIFMLLKKPTDSVKYLILPALCAFTFMITMACSFETGQVEEMITNKSSFTEIQEKEYQKIMDAVVLLQAEAEKALQQDPKEFIYPIDKNVISSYGMRMHPVENVKRMHLGVDFLAKMGSPIKAVADGEVILIQKQPNGYGLQVEIRHANGFVSKSAHLSEAKVSLGQKIKQGDVIALSGNTGKSKAPHLHFELIKDGKRLDPEKYLKR